MIPLRDDQPTFSTPFVNYFLIALNVLVFLWELSVGHRALNSFMMEFGVVPPVSYTHLDVYKRQLLSVIRSALA